MPTFFTVSLLVMKWLTKWTPIAWLPIILGSLTVGYYTFYHPITMFGSLIVGYYTMYSSQIINPIIPHVNHSCVDDLATIQPSKINSPTILNDFFMHCLLLSTAVMSAYCCLAMIIMLWLCCMCEAVCLLYSPSIHEKPHQTSLTKPTTKLISYCLPSLLTPMID